jgi:hypothetical protein
MTPEQQKTLIHMRTNRPDLDVRVILEIVDVAMLQYRGIRYMADLARILS